MISLVIDNIKFDPKLMQNLSVIDMQWQELKQLYRSTSQVVFYVGIEMQNYLTWLTVWCLLVEN